MSRSKVMAIVLSLLMILSVLSAFGPFAPVFVRPVAAQFEDEPPIEVFLKPGVEDPFKPGWSHTLDSLRGTQGGEDQIQHVLANYNEYAIFATSAAFRDVPELPSIGDFEFRINVKKPLRYIDIFVPPEFEFSDFDGDGKITTADIRASVWTDITNDYWYLIGTAKLGPLDPIAPGWTRIRIGFTFVGWQVIVPDIYRVRFFSLKAPTTIGVYHFKIYVRTETEYASIGSGNYPITVVKGEVNPAFIRGTVEAAPGVSGKVIASAEYPPRSGRVVKAWAFFSIPEDPNAWGAESHGAEYFLLGLPAGFPLKPETYPVTYTLTASAGGFPPLTREGIVLVPGQSRLEPPITLSAGPELQVHVLSKDADGASIAWHNLWQPPFGTNDPTLPPCAPDEDVKKCPPRDILIELYDEAGKQLLAFVGSDAFGVRGYPAALIAPPTNPLLVDYGVRFRPLAEWDGHVPADKADFVSGIAAGTALTIKAWVTGYELKSEVTLTLAPGLNFAPAVEMVRTNWFKVSVVHEPPVDAATLVVLASKDGIERGRAVYRVPAGRKAPAIILEGFSASYAKDSGLEPGTYELDIRMADDGVTPFEAPKAPWLWEHGVGWYTAVVKPKKDIDLGLAAVPVRLETLVTSLTLRVRSVTGSSSSETPWLFPGAEIWTSILDEKGRRVAGISPIRYGFVQDDGSIGSPWEVTASLLELIWTGEDVSVAAALAGLNPTNIPSGTYSFVVSSYGYVMRRSFPVHIPEGGEGNIQVDLTLGIQLLVAVKFDYDFSGFVRVEVFDEARKLVGSEIYGQEEFNPAAGGEYLVGLEDWKVEPAIFVNRRWLSSRLYGVPALTYAGYPATSPSDANRLVIPADNIQYYSVFGFYWTFGGPSSRNEGLWANGWETTDGVRQPSPAQPDGGIRGSDPLGELEGGGTYTVRVWAFDPFGPDDEAETADDWESYYMVTEVGVKVPWGKGVLVPVTVSRLARLQGQVFWRDLYEDRRNLAWAKVEVTGSPEVVTYTTSPPGLPYLAWVMPGSYSVAFSLPIKGLEGRDILSPASRAVTLRKAEKRTVSVDLGVGTGVPIPEFPIAMPLALVSALAAAVYLLRRRRAIALVKLQA